MQTGSPVSVFILPGSNFVSEAITDFVSTILLPFFAARLQPNAHFA